MYTNDNVLSLPSKGDKEEKDADKETEEKMETDKEKKEEKDEEKKEEKKPEPEKQKEEPEEEELPEWMPEEYKDPIKRLPIEFGVSSCHSLKPCVVSLSVGKSPRERLLFTW